MFATANPLTLPLSGTGSAGMEASFVNFVRPGDPVVVGVNGLFGERMCEVAARAGAEVVRVDAPWGRPLDPEAVLGAHPSPAMIAVVHAETSTGVRNEVAPIGAGKGDALLVADTVTSLGGMEVAVDDWQVDIAYSGTQKCLGVPPGLAPLTVSDQARDRLVPRPSSWYLDLNLLSHYVTSGEGGGRVYHHTAPVTMIGALHAGLGALLEEGLPAVWARHEECGRALQRGLEELGLELLAAGGQPAGPADHGASSPTASRRGWTRRPAAGRSSSATTSRSAAGRGSWPEGYGGSGCMGHTAAPANVVALLGALREILDGDGPHRAGDAARVGRPADLAAHHGRGRLPGLVRGAGALPGLAGALGAPAAGCRCRPRTGGASWPAAPSASASASSAAASASGSSSQGRFAGEVTLSSIQRGPFQSGFIGYWIDQAMAGNGYVPEAVVMTLHFAFEAINLHRVEISIIPRNRASLRVVEKLGLRMEGVAERFLEIDGEWEDHARFAMTSEDWQARRRELLRAWLGRE